MGVDVGGGDQDLVDPVNDLVEDSGGHCPRCGHTIQRVSSEASRVFGETEYLCAQCGWTFETGLDPEDGELI